MLALDVPSFDALSVEAKSFLAVVLDFNGIAREKIASVSLQAAVDGTVPVNKPQELKAGETGTLFSKPLKNEKGPA